MEVVLLVNLVPNLSNVLRWPVKVFAAQAETVCEIDVQLSFAENICSESGGRAKNPLRSTPYDPGMRFDQLTGEQANYAVGISTRYYYNPIDGQCHPFTYNGFLGNFNNFQTQSDCQIFCARCITPKPVIAKVFSILDVKATTIAEPKCPQGRAYLDYSGKFLQCGEGNGRRAYLDYSGKFLHCGEGNGRLSCPANYECHFDGHVHGCCPSKG
ncbi:unnamed protein product [Strongylus vulgaris]|uniref:BPTI/Kunitz inhibitor domain-containing protein n=1 Tax=Strongylus vulgaris TaxID=40348 RepID=A0A3P7J8S8_STRVU|nr:unnamed protein product [Strongylus vulgaris]